MHIHDTIKNKTITHIGIQIIPCLSHRYIHEFYYFFLLYFIFILFFGYTHKFTLFYWGFFLWFIYIKLFVFCTTLTHLEIKKQYR